MSKAKQLWVVREEYETNKGRTVEYHGACPDPLTARNIVIRRFKAIAQDCDSDYATIHGLYERQELANGGLVWTNDVNKIEIYPVELLKRDR